MDFINAFKGNTKLVETFGISNAYLIWVMSLYLDESNLNELASECLTDGSDDKKIDFIKLDYDSKKIVFAQGYYAEKLVDSAPANKASDLNTASAWLISGNVEVVPPLLRDRIIECREAINNGDVEQIDLLYVHNLPESKNVEKELKTAQEHLSNVINEKTEIVVIADEYGLTGIETIFKERSSQIIITKQMECPAKIQFEQKGNQWDAAILSVPGSWLRSLYKTEGDKLFSANYRGFLGISKRKKKNINLDIKNTAEKQPVNFWVYNNGVTILTHNYTPSEDKESTTLTGISIINGAQTTGSLSSLDGSTNLENVLVLARVIKCTNTETIEEIIKYNNTQNEITSWDKFSNDPIQKTIKDEFKIYGHIYNLKRGFTENAGEVGIENVIQPLISLMGHFQESNRGKNGLFLSKTLYLDAFSKTKARHILFAYCLNQSIDTIRVDLKSKKIQNTIIDIEEKMLTLLVNLRFKNYFIAIFGECLEILLGKKINDIKDVVFTTQESKNSVYVITNDLLPVVNFVLTLTTTTISNFSLILEEKNSLNRISGVVSSILYASLVSVKDKRIDDFRKILSVE